MMQLIENNLNAGRYELNWHTIVRTVCRYCNASLLEKEKGEIQIEEFDSIMFIQKAFAFVTEQSVTEEKDRAVIIILS